MTTTEDDFFEDYESGPFCRHWSDPADCDEVCASCGHKCTEHSFEEPTECLVDDCYCLEWKEEE